MGNIVILDENTANKIAAGEVVERPASVVKEMVENSIDAGATAVSVEIKNGGITYIKVTDNGLGIDEDDVIIAFERHATSKIRSADDLEAISSMGFRGEALASIAAVAQVELSTRKADMPAGTYVKIQGGTLKESRQIGCPTGTTFIVRDLFYNTPARFKFLKKDSTEAGYIGDILGRIALSRPDISLRLISNNQVQLHSPGNNDLLSAIYSVYGKETAKQVWKIEYDNGKMKVSGYAGKPEIARANRNHQSFFINGRYIKSKVISSAIDEAYKTFLMKNKFPFIVLNVEINPIQIDVNVHPTKMEVRFSEEQEVFRSIYHAISNAILGNNAIISAQLKDKDRNVFKFENNKTPSDSYTQQDLGYNAYTAGKTENGYSKIGENADNFTASDESIRKQSLNVTNDFNSNNNKGFSNTGGPIIAEGKLINTETKKIPGAGEDLSESSDVLADDGKIADLLNMRNSYIPENKSIPSDEKTFRTAEKEQDLNPEKVIIKDKDMTQLPYEKNDVDVSVIENKYSKYEEPPSKVNILKESRLIGQVFSTYILLQHGDEMLIIDQHAAHERIMYEKLRAKYNNNESLAQMLIAPVVIEFTNKEIKFLEGNNEFFSKLRFIYEDFGNNCIILRSIPNVMDNGNVKSEFCDIVDFMINSITGDVKAVTDEQLYTIACKAAVKANKKLDELEIESLINELSNMENPYSCPHGRPTILEITKYEIEKMFKRVL